MRPLNIKIAGFGTYCKPTEIDFSKLGNQGLYLITGNTGSGKTTIFDAITFALYGEPSGSNRDPSMLRSSFATGNEPTFVEMEFEFRGKKYFIKRNPSYKRANKRGEGTTTESAEAELKLPDGNIVTKVKDVNKKIEDILGIKKTQFCQIAMIAQGDFQKLLFETSENRQDFFRTLFKTENYLKIQEILKGKVSQIKSVCDSTDEILNHEINSIYSGENSLFKNHLEEAKNTAMNWEDKIKIIKDIIQEDFNIKEKLSIEGEKIQKELDNVKIKLSQINELKEDKIRAESLTKQLEQKENLLKELSITVAAKKSAFDECGEKEKEKALISQDLEKYDNLEIKEKELKNLNGEILKNENFIAQSEKIIENQNQVIKNLEKKLEELKNVSVNHQKFLALEEKLDEREKTLGELENKVENLNNLKNQLIKAQNEYKVAGEKYQGARENYGAMNKAFMDGQAGILAAGLEDGKPCPVCGALTHPAPCNVSGKVPSELELKEAKKLSEKCEMEAGEKSQNAAKIGAEVQAREEDISGIYNKLFNNCFNEESYGKIFSEKENVKNELSKVRESLKEEAAKISEKEKAEKSLPGAKEYLENIKSQSIEKNNQLIENRTQVENIEKNIEEMKAQLKFQNKNDAKSRISKLEQQIDFIKKTYQTALDQFNNENNIVNEIKGNLSEISKRLENCKIQEESDVELKFDELSKKKEENYQEFESVVTRLKMNERSLENISKNVGQLIKSEEELKMVESLSATANGTLGSGHEKIQLETYIQMAYFDKILRYANTRLLIMSEGQYELVRKTEAGDLRTKTGLDLNVIDHYNGCQRSVKSLSGGECFQASLSLALGLSDEVTNAAGGIKIDTMFVDEGFGSLDPDSIQKAYEALVSVTQGQKLVGIISHVDYLKEKIDKQIVVTKTRDCGSSVTIKV